MITTWDNIIKSNAESINLIWYGSILNKITHEWDTSHPQTVIVKGFQRIYNLKMVPDGFCRKKLEIFANKYWKKYNIHTMEQVEELGKTSYCVLNAVYTNNPEDNLNGALVNIPRKDFEVYQKREEIYDLYKTHYYYFDTESWDIRFSKDWGYILSAHTEYLIDNWCAFPAYHQLARDGAYHFWEKFGKIFDQTTFSVK